MAVVNECSEVWYIQNDPNATGSWPKLFSTMEAAEMYAQLCFPDESPDRRYARIFYRRVFDLSSPDYV